MKPKIILHCGAPGTGSSVFQRLLNVNSDLLIRAGIHSSSAPVKRRSREDVGAMLGAIMRPDNDNQVFMYRIREVLSGMHAESEAHTLIVSADGILGKPFSQRSTSFYPDANQIAARIRMTLDDYDIDVRFVIQDYAAFLPSCYIELVRMGSTLAFEDFLRVFDFDSINWTVPVDALRRYFGAASVNVFEHADFVRDPHAFFSTMFPEVMGVLGERGRQLHDESEPPGTGMVEIVRRWNQVSSRLTPNRNLQHFVRRLGLMPLERFSKSEKIRLPEALAERLLERYQVDAALIDPRRVDFDEADAVRHAAQ